MQSAYIDTVTAKYRNEVEKASAANLAEGFNTPEGRKFGPAASITRQEACVMIYRLIRQLEGLNEDYTLKDINFSDNKKIASWAVAAVAYCSRNEMIKGQGSNSFNPLGLITREELLTILDRYIAKNR